MPAAAERNDRRGVRAMAKKGKGQPASGDQAPARVAGKVHPKILDRQMQSALGRHLRAVFDDVANAPVPDKFMKLLQELEDKEKQR